MVMPYKPCLSLFSEAQFSLLLESVFQVIVFAQIVFVFLLQAEFLLWLTLQINELKNKVKSKRIYKDIAYKHML